uniref:Uncharacterized protein n=1 Tax=Chenopodium quinoa TaxID=63459 RepID=A0A803L9V9_CHEQI
MLTLKGGFVIRFNFSIVVDRFSSEAFQIRLMNDNVRLVEYASKKGGMPNVRRRRVGWGFGAEVVVGVLRWKTIVVYLNLSQMASRRHNGSSSSTSSRNFGLVSPKLKCRCGLESITRTVKNGENVWLKFHGCPRWPWVNVNLEDIDDLRLQVFERDTQVAEKEMEIDLLKEQLKRFEKKLGNKEDELDDTKMELCHTRIELMKATRNEKNFSLALFVSWIFFAFMIAILKA